MKKEREEINVGYKKVKGVKKIRFEEKKRHGGKTRLHMGEYGRMGEKKREGCGVCEEGHREEKQIQQGGTKKSKKKKKRTRIGEVAKQNTET